MIASVKKNKENWNSLLKALFNNISTNSPALKHSLIVFLCGRLLFTLVGILVWWSQYRPPYANQYYYNIPPVLNGVMGALFGVWQRWDGIHYQRLATYGYTEDLITSLFYPLYPVLSQWLAELTNIDVLISLQIISNVAFLTSLVLMYKIAAHLFSEAIGLIIITTMVFFPSGYYFYAIYPQSLLLMLILLTYALILRGWWAGALITGFLSGLTHSTSVVLSILVGVEALLFLWPSVRGVVRNERIAWKWNFLFAALAPFANLLGTFSFFSWRTTAGYPPYADLQADKYARALTMPWDGAAEVIRFILHLPNDIHPFVAYLNIATFSLVIFLTVWSFRRIPWSWWIMQTGFLIFLSTNLTVGNPLIGFIRYIIVIFPIFVSLAILCQKPKQRLILFAVGALLAIIYSTMFFMWQYDLS